MADPRPESYFGQIWGLQRSGEVIIASRVFTTLMELPEVLSAWGAVKCGAHFGFYQSLVKRAWEISIEPWPVVDGFVDSYRDPPVILESPGATGNRHDSLDVKKVANTFFF